MKLSLALALASAPGAHGSGEVIGGYTTHTNVFEHNRIDLDQRDIQTALANDNFRQDAWDIYQGGAYSTKQVTLKLTNPSGSGVTVAIAATELICQGTSGIRCATSKAAHSIADGASEDVIVYYTQSSSNGCMEGGLPDDDGNTVWISAGNSATTGNLEDGEGSIEGRQYKKTATCIQKYADNTDDIYVGEMQNKILQQTAGAANEPATVYRTIHGFSSGAEAKMGTSGLSEPMYLLYKEFYGSATYANDLVYSVKSTTTSCGSSSSADNNIGVDCGVDFCKQYFCLPGDGSAVTTYVTDKNVRTEIMKKASAYLTVWMYVIHELEDAIGDCLAGTIENNYNPVHATDEAMAFYTGTLEGQSGFSGNPVDTNVAGYLIFALADKRCQNFGTCTGMPSITSGSNTDGGSLVNQKVATNMQWVARYCTMLECEKARDHMDLVKAQMTVPLVQGVIRYAYYNSKSTTNLKKMAEGAVFWASIAPQVNKCNSAGAGRISAALWRPMITASAYAGGDDTLQDIMDTLQGCYPSMGITCADVGKLLEAGDSNPAGKACVDPSVASTGTTTTKDGEEKLPDWAIPALIVLALVSVVLLAMGVQARGQASHWKEMYKTFSEGGGAKGSGRRV